MRDMDSTPPEVEVEPAERGETRGSPGTQRGQGMVEYGLIICLVAIGALLALQVLGHASSNLYSNISNSFGP
jgi:pilus assembly protein Flp/PilA